MARKQRTYERTHPWITFEIDIGRISPRLWMLLGEARSKCEHLAEVPLKPSVAESLHQLYLAKGVHATTAIEGNTLTEAEVQLRIQRKLELPPSKEYLVREVDNVLNACERIIASVIERDEVKISLDEICEFDRLVLSGLENPAGVVLGQIRNYDVTVGPYDGAPAHDCHFLLTRLSEWLNNPSWFSESEQIVPFSLIRAILAHLYIAWIHPFGDGNGRTARLMEVKILISAGIPTVAAHLLSDHYNHTRADYYRNLQVASGSPEGVYSFLEYALQGFLGGLRVQLRRVWRQQWSLAWRDYVHEVLDGESAAETRQRHLVLDIVQGSLEPISIFTKAMEPYYDAAARRGVDMVWRRDPSLHGIPVRPKQIPSISPRVASDYAKVSAKTLSRDLQALEDLDLLRQTEEGYVANVDLVLGLRPRRRKSATS